MDQSGRVSGLTFVNVKPNSKAPVKDSPANQSIHSAFVESMKSAPGRESVNYAFESQGGITRLWTLTDWQSEAAHQSFRKTK